MQIEKLNENKIRITLSIEDLKEKNIDVHSFMSKPIETQSLFLDVLDVAEEKFGFVTKDCKISIEALAMSNNIFVLTVTKVASENDKKKKKVLLKRKIENINKNSAVYCFQTFDDFLEFCNFVNNNLIKEIHTYVKNISLYSLNDKYYLIFNNITADLCLLKIFCTAITEFASYAPNSELFGHKLLEYGKLIIVEDAINTGIKYFVK